MNQPDLLPQQPVPMPSHEPKLAGEQCREGNRIHMRHDFRQIGRNLYCTQCGGYTPIIFPLKHHKNE